MSMMTIRYSGKTVNSHGPDMAGFMNALADGSRLAFLVQKMEKVVQAEAGRQPVSLSMTGKCPAAKISRSG
jgi:hypothetical protein